MKKTKKTLEYELPKDPETVNDIIDWLLAVTKGHERYPHDTAKLGRFPISYMDIHTLADRLKKAYARERRKQRKDVLFMVKDLYMKNKNVLRHLDEVRIRYVNSDFNPVQDQRNVAFGLIYSIELQHLIHWYGFLKEFENLDEKEPCKVHEILKKNQTKR